MAVHASPAAVRPRGAPPAGAYWERKTLKYDCLHDRLLCVAEVLAAAKPGTVFDLGCSTGELARALAERAPSLVYHGCDIAASAVERFGSPRVVQCDLNQEAMPFAEMQFDAASASGICEYVADLKNFFAQLVERLAPRGLLVASYVNTGCISRRWRRLLGRQAAGDPTWQTLVSLAHFEQELSRAGLRVVERRVTDGRILRADQRRRGPVHSVWRAACERAPSVARWLAPQVIYVCRKER